MVLPTTPLANKEQSAVVAPPNGSTPRFPAMMQKSLGDALVAHYGTGICHKSLDLPGPFVAGGSGVNYVRGLMGQGPQSMPVLVVPGCCHVYIISELKGWPE